MRKLALISFLGQGVGFLFHYLTLFVLVRVVSVNEFGLFQKFNLFLTTIIPFIGFTLVSSLFYFYPKASRIEQQRIIQQTTVLLGCCGLVFYLVFIAWKSLFLQWMQLESLESIPSIIFLSVPLYLVASLADNIFLLDQSKKVLLLFLPIDKIGFLISILAWHKVNETTNSIFYGILFYAICKFTFIISYVIKKHVKPLLEIDKNLLIQQLRYCIPFYIANVAYVLSIKFDKIYVNRFISTEEFAVYSISFLSIPLLSSAFASINNVAITEFTGLIAKGEINQVKTLYRNVVTKTSAIALPFVVFFFINGHEIIELFFTEEYASAVFYYRIYLLSFLISLTSYGLILRAANKTRMIFILNVSSAAFSIIAAVYLINSFRITGAITSAVIAITLPGVLQLIAEMKFLKSGIREFFPIGKLTLITIISLIALPLIRVPSFFTDSNVLFLAISFLLYFTLVAVLMSAGNVLPFQDKLRKYFPLLARFNKT